MDKPTHIFFNSLDIYAEQYVMEYDRLKQQYPWWSYKTLMRVAKEVTDEYLYLKLKEELPKGRLVWPEGF